MIRKRSAWAWRRYAACVSVAVWLAAGPSSLPGADQASIKQAVAKGGAFLRGAAGEQTPGLRSLVALALFKAGEPPNSPIIAGVVTSIQQKITDGAYHPQHSLVQYQNYEAGIDAALLADIGGEVEPGTEHPYVGELGAISAYLVSQQLANGGWDYPPGHPRGVLGDTSVVQYALLGLWAASRSGVKIDSRVWSKAIQWHVSQQERDGGFTYVPGTTQGHSEGNSTLNMTINALGSTYIGLMQLSPGRPLPALKNPVIEQTPEVVEEKKFGVLEKVDLDQLPGQPRDEEPRANIPPATDKLISQAYDWLVPRFAPENPSQIYGAYYYYSLERFAALADVEMIGEQHWFDVCADSLLSKQESDGSWKLATTLTPAMDTSFAVLFLTRSTAKILKRTVPVDPIGGGLLSGGRGGLGGTAEPGTKKPVGALDELLASLDSAGDLEVADVQDAFVEQVQVGDRNALIGQTDLLIKYVRHANPEIRRTAVWALGRTDSLSLGRYLIDALDDPDLGVVVEARNALCWLARRPNGLGEAGDPLESIPPDANEEQQGAAVTAWRMDLLKRWGRWYLQNRPYADRGDDFEAALLEKLAAAI
ncbi:MAG: HEAT repeat domain-containing protein [Planctomycetaceae bacterium]|nr:HEAT repeat domain-containing protein [Planctomycetaceae bacterium]